MTESSHAEHAAPGQHEPDVVNTRVILIASGGLALLLTLVLTGMYLVVYQLPSLEENASPQPARLPRQTDSLRGPLVTTNQVQQLQELREAETLQLHQYEWIDQAAGVARIPIERAMQILAENPVPPAKPPAEETTDDQLP
ncbi:hypothetical protein [Lignipirellula cremea]|uniref:Uncharacterized protein n=1 Tax=Lignipirellula cremea TaxID=2528010 RepID=A0A518E1X7_9BACT|nr:hypothetical protein [Lignipirellula cremea]QDU98096.1 hypothetical protein Pla8534_59570 [Lignipirellula cremea]